MGLEIHPSASAHFNSKAAALVELIEEIPPDPQPKPGFASERHVAATLTESDIIGEIDESLSDYRGRTIARFFRVDNRKYGLAIKSYENVIQLAEKLQSLPTLSSKLSRSFIENSLFAWLKKKFKQEDVDTSFLDFLGRQAALAIQSITLWTPVSHLEIEVPFPVSQSELRPLSRSVIDEWERKVLPLSNRNGNVSALFDKLRKDFQGLAAVVTKVSAEPERAREIAMEESERVTAVLGIFSAATLIPDIKCVSKIRGSENIRIATTILEFEGERFQTQEGIVDIGSAQVWRLSRDEITEIRTMGLDAISRLLAAESLNEFEKAVLSSVLLYSKSAFTSDPLEKLVYVLSSLERILLKNENEPIQQNLAERIAIFSGDDLDARKRIIKTIKSAYSIRSRYLHHGHTHSELVEMSEFLTYARIFFVHLVANVARYSSKDDFIGAIDDRKLA
jgi:hypothetical protein